MISKIFDFLSGSFGKKVVDTVKEYYPPDMTEEQRKLLDLHIEQATHKQLLELREAHMSETAQLTDRIKSLEGTAKDLQQFGFIGKTVIFLRGLQRPIWGYATIYIDFMAFSGQWTISQQQEVALWIINALVLGFLFGERAVKNVAPLLAQLKQTKG